MKELLQSGGLGAPGPFHEACIQQIQAIQGARHVLLMPSCTHALEAIGILQGWGPGDEVIVPVFGFPSMSNCVALRGATPVFAGIDPLTMNLDPFAAEQAITPRTKAILAMHYGGVACDMEALAALAGAYGIALIEDAAHGIGAKYGQEGLGTLGDYGALSFHSTKNIHCGEGGALLFRQEADLEKFLQIAEKERIKPGPPKLPVANPGLQLRDERIECCVSACSTPACGRSQRPAPGAVAPLLRGVICLWAAGTATGIPADAPTSL
ncbi:MAG: aminotransferase class I/II-fold pyridoxal phosphate-dependent enzyme [Haliscomenobacter sp.]|nr:aminotransferase class I/II-fold pyridoxal phosphate-dependent enzyme [Haliscomenobacter sp.]